MYGNVLNLRRYFLHQESIALKLLSLVLRPIALKLELCLKILLLLRTKFVINLWDIILLMEKFMILQVKDKRNQQNGE